MEPLIIPKGVKEISTDSAGNYGSQDITGTKSKVVYCRKCVISNQRPRISFDDEGICSACRYTQKKENEIDWDDREKQLVDLLDNYRKNDGSYDCLVPVSGGKDSCFVAHQLKFKYNMNPLLVTFAPLRWSKIGWQNLQSLIDTGFDTEICVPNTYAYRLLSRLSTEYLGDPFQPFVYGVKAYPIRMALKHNISLIFFGENGEVEYGGDMKNANSFMHDVGEDLRNHYFKGMMPSDWEKHGVDKKLLHSFALPNPDQVQDKQIKCTWFSFFKKWTPQWNFYYAKEHTGFEPEADGRSEGTYSKYASIDDKLDGFHYYLGFIKFGIGRATSDAAHEIRDGHISREEGVALVKKYDGEFPKKNYELFLQFMDMTDEHFKSIVDRFRPSHLWDKNNDEWQLKYQVSNL